MRKINIASMFLVIFYSTNVFSDCVQRINCIKTNPTTVTCTCSDPVEVVYDIGIINTEIEHQDINIKAMLQRIVDLNVRIRETESLILELQDKKNTYLLLGG